MTSNNRQSCSRPTTRNYSGTFRRILRRSTVSALSLWCLVLQCPSVIIASSTTTTINDQQQQPHQQQADQLQAVQQGKMSLSQFQSILRTFVDDEMAYVIDSIDSIYEHDEHDDSDNNNILNSPSLVGRGRASIDKILDVALKKSKTTTRVVSSSNNNNIVDNFADNGLEIVTEGQHLKMNHRHDDVRRRRALLLHHRQQQHRQERQLPGKNKDEKQHHSKEEKNESKHHHHRPRGRYPDIPIPQEVEVAWESIVSHAWDYAKLSSSSSLKRKDPSSRQKKQQDAKKKKKKKGVKSTRGRRMDEKKENDIRKTHASNDHFLISKEEEDPFFYNVHEDDEDDDEYDEYDMMHEVIINPDDYNNEYKDSTHYNNWTHGITLDEDENEQEILLPFSNENEGESLFLTCHHSPTTRPLSGNEHLKLILVRSGKDGVTTRTAIDEDGQADTTSDLSYYNVVISSPNLVCVILGMQPTYAEAIANKEELIGISDNNNNEEEEEEEKTFMTIVPWVDVMKISPELFAHILSSSSNNNNNNNKNDSSPQQDADATTKHTPSRGLRNFKRQTMQEEKYDHHEEDEDYPMRNLMWENNNDAQQHEQQQQNNHVVFSLIPPFNTMEDAMVVIGDLIVMAQNGQRRNERRRRMAEDQVVEDEGVDYDAQTSGGRYGRKLTELTIQDAFSITQSRVGDHSESSSSSSSRIHWSRIFSRGLESDGQNEQQQQFSCVSILENIELESSFQSSFEFPLAPSSPTTTGKITSYDVDPECIASIVAGLSTHPRVINVGILSKTVQLHNVNAQWVAQGQVVTTNSNNSGERKQQRKRPFFDAGLDGSGQIVSVSDTGLDVDNCYFKDHRGVGMMFDGGWDYTRRKVVKYEVSKRGGDTSDTQRGHGTHVVGTVAGHHLLDGTVGDGDDPKEGIAPGAKIHFYDIGEGYIVNDPRESWFDSFHKSNQRGAKIATGSWGFGYRESYDWVCQLYDQLMIDHPDVLYVASAGNTGNKFESGPFNTVGAPASCKNVFGVGATSSVGFGAGLHYVVDFSSRGPTSDGRTKPDILAPGYALDSALSGSTDCKAEEPGYLKAGTSMAAPVIAGVGAQVRQYFQDGFYPCGARGCGVSVHPSGTLVKAVIANGAQLTRGVQKGGTTTVIGDVQPYDNTQNMGETNLLTSLPLQDENDFNIFIQNDTPLSDEKSWYLDLDMDECASDFSATLAWYDPPGANGCMKCLRNDLDLRIESLSTSKIYYPNGKSKADDVNNIERIRIAKPRTALGEQFKVTVNPSMLGPGYSEQKFSLVVTGCFSTVNEEMPPTDPFPLPSMIHHELINTYNANRKQAGNMFGIKAKEDGVAITAFAIHTQVIGRNIKLHVYALNRSGGLNGNEEFLDDSSQWTMISPSGGIEVPAMGLGSPTVIPKDSFDPVPIAKGTTRSFYITFIDEAEMLYQAVDADYPTGATYTNDYNIEVMTGVGKGVNFGTNWQSRQMNGSVFYSVSNDSSGSPPSTPISTSMPTKEPTKTPSKRPTLQPTKRPVQPPSFPFIPLFIELETTYNANKKQAGNMFDVFAKKDVTISSFKIHTLLTNSIPVTVYTRLGSWENYDKDPDAWEEIATVNVDCKGYGKPTIVSNMTSIQIESGSTRSFYLTFDEPEMLYYYSEGNPSGSVYAEDSAIKIMTGAGKAKGFGTTTFLSRQLNGALVYHLS